MRRSVELFVAAIVSLGIGVLIGALWAGSSSRALDGAALVEPRGGESARSRELPVAWAGEREGEPVSPADAAAPAERRALAATEAEERPPPPAVEPGVDAARDGVVEGSVVTLSGAPLAGVELELEPPPDAPRYRARRATTGADGRFEFRGLPAGTWDVTGRHPDHVLQRRTSYPTRVPTGARVDFVASPGTRVHVLVVGPGAERARVAYQRDGNDETRWSSWSPAHPELTLGPGAWTLCALVDPLEDWPSDSGWKLAALASPEHTVQVGLEQTEVVTLALESVRCLHGKVVLPEGYQSRDSRPRLSVIEPVDGTCADFESPGDRAARSSRVDEQGRFGFFRLPHERWTAGLVLTWGAPSACETVEVQGLTRFDFDRIDFDERESVLVDAFSPAGQRITEGLSMTLLHRDPGDEPEDYLWQRTRTVLEDGGSLRVIPMPMDQEDARRASGKRELVLRASMAGFAVIEERLAGLNGDRVRLTFAPSAELVVELVGEGGLRAMRQAHARLEGKPVTAGARFDEGSGALEFRGLHPGAYTLSVHSWAEWNGDWRQERLFRGPVEVLPGPQRLEIPVPTRADLLVRCPGAKAGVEASLVGVAEDRTRDEDDRWGNTFARAKVDELGQVRFEGMLPGTYRLTIGPRAQLVRVPGPAVDFEGVLPERFLFRLDAGDSPLRRAGVRSGDVLVAIDGQELSKEAAEKRLEALSSQRSGTLQLTVERSGQQLDLTLDADDLGEGESFEARLDPDLDGGPG